MAVPTEIKTPQQPRLPVELTVTDGLSVESEEAIDECLVTDIEVEVNAKYVEITASRLVGVQLTGVELDELSLTDVVLEDCELSGAMFIRASLKRVRFDRCRLSGFDAPEVNASDVTFSECKLDQANFRQSQWQRAHFDRCEMSKADFGSARLESVRIEACTLVGTHFDHTVCKAVSLEGSKLESIQGIDGLKGATIGANQVMTIAPTALRLLGIAISE